MFWATVWDWLKKFGNWVAFKVAAPWVAILIVVGAVILVALGFKELQIGGLLNKLLGRLNPTKKAIAVVNSIPKDRVDENGNLIQPGTPDSKGMTQVQVVPIKDPGLFSNPDTVKFTPTDSSDPIEIALPIGVKAKDVDTVVVIQPDVMVVTVKDTTSVSVERIDDLLAKYGSI